MIELKEVEFTEIQKFFIDFQKQSDCFELPPENAMYVGAYDDDKLVGYYSLVDYDGIDLEVNQGYLRKEARHKNLAPICMEKLRQEAKKAGFKRILFCTQNRFKSYMKFAKLMGYRPSKLIFEREV